MTTSRDVTMRDVYAARRRLAAHLTPTPLRQSEWLTVHCGAPIRLKLESIQPTNSFKIRGALNAILRLVEQHRRPRIVAASAGNHGRAVAFACRLLGLEAVIFTPSAAPETKKMAIRQLGATLRDDPVDYDAAEQLARAYADTSDALYVSPYNHPDVIAGAGTIALELLESAPDTQTVVVPLGGGGLAGGVAMALKNAAPHLRVVGVEVAASTPFATGLRHGQITRIAVGASLADGLIGNLEDGSITFGLVQRYVDELVSIGEDALRDAVRALAREEHLIVEGAGAAATAAVLGQSMATRGQRSIVLVTGANIDIGKLAAILSE